MSRASLFVPLGIFLLLGGLFLKGFYLSDPHDLPSALLDRPFPAFSLPRLDSGAAVGVAELEGQVRLVNVWATWCPTCKAEHKELMRIATDEGVSIVGVNYKDDPVEARRWLVRYGDPYVFNIVDEQGRLGVDLGVYGAPETFLVDQRGVIRFKIVGDVNRQRWESELKPRIAALREGS